MNSIYHTNKLKKKTHITSSTDEAKASDSIQHWFWTNTLKTLGIEGNFVNLICTYAKYPYR